ncbi:alpha/beta fold hydrolase [Hymenobacter arizonensis]|uniref:Pimeloyl-ACP methyl ester carboxylesterase n=1 Tax=Hymenobacter arizonensis TaxID=1227077 RepID=A0A1I5WWM5_HYMAR|nr:alpha/beta fold hydrolase [Hymenobacter arizonensis]SFQ24079.1 Pimeloyl-ACP methyl ester carboxylesterase [Hymenobacter arizonensis]
MPAPSNLPTIVFLHGFAESREVWTAFTRSFPDDYRLLAPNLPGHGTNLAPVPDFSMEAQARHVIEYLGQKDCANPVLLVCHSMGGYVALALAERWPQRVAGLALINSTALADTDEKRQNREKNIGFVERHGVAKFMESFVRPLFAPVNRDKLNDARALLEEIGKATPETTITGALRGMAARPDRTQVLANAKFPVLMVAGKHDVAVHFEDAVRQAAMPAVAHALFLEGSGHQSYLEQAEETRRAVLALAGAVFRK